MIVVADTSPLNYIVQIGCESILPGVYQHVLIPRSVFEELAHPDAPNAVSEWIRRSPSWLEVRRTITTPDVSLAELDPGERDAIQLALEQQADLLLIDEMHGRLEAQRRGLATTGTLGVLLAAADRGLLDAGAAYQQLITTTNFRCSVELQDTFLKRLRDIDRSRG